MGDKEAHAELAHNVIRRDKKYLPFKTDKREDGDGAK